MVTLNAVPAVCVAMLDSAKVDTVPVPLTVKFPELPVAPPWVTVSDVVWAS